MAIDANTKLDGFRYYSVHVHNAKNPCKSSTNLLDIIATRFLKDISS